MSWDSILPLIGVILGGLIAYFSTWAASRAKEKLEDRRRFEPEIIELYETIDKAVGDLHEMQPADEDDPEDVERELNYWIEHYVKITKASIRLQVIAPESIYKIAWHIRSDAIRMRPDRPGGPDFTMPELVEGSEHLRLALRKELRIPD